MVPVQVLVPHARRRVLGPQWQAVLGLRTQQAGAVDQHRTDRRVCNRERDRTPNLFMTGCPPGALLFLLEELD